MFNKTAAAALTIVLSVSVLSAQEKKGGGAKSVMHDITVTTPENVYSGTVDLMVDAGKVTGKMLMTSPTEITGTVAGTSKAGVLNLEFPYHMKEQNCDGIVKMTIPLPENMTPTKGTMQATACGANGGDGVAGTVELKPSAAKPAGRGGQD